MGVEKNSVFLFGEAVSQFDNPLRRLGINVHQSVEGCHPFAVVGNVNHDLDFYLKDCTAVPIVTQIKKNFSNMLSRDIEDFESNIDSNHQKAGKEVDVCNCSEYLVINLAGVVRPLYKIGKAIYGQYGRIDEFLFTKDLVTKEKLDCVVDGVFNWKHYMDMFAKACLHAYDSDKIILIRMNRSNWYIADEIINREEKIQHEKRVYIREVENYFIDVTHCHCINRSYAYVRNEKEKNIWSFSPLVQEEISRDINEIMLNDSERKFCPYSHKITRELFWHLNRNKESVLRQELGKFDCEIDGVIYQQFLDNNLDDLHKHLGKIGWFISNGCALSDYIREINDKIDIELLELYTEYFKLNIDDILAIFYMYNKLEMKERLRGVLQNICKNVDCYPAITMREFIRRNQKYLIEYKLLDEKLLVELNKGFVANNEQCFIRLNENIALCIQPCEENMISLLRWNPFYRGYETIFDNGMICGIQEIESISTDWRFYIRRAKLKKETTPLYCVIKDVNEFFKSLIFLDYEQIFESENAIVCLQENINKMKMCVKDYRSKCSLEPLMSDEARIFYINNGLSDQINFYVLSKMIQEASHIIPYYDDMKAREIPVFNGIEICKVAKEDKKDISNRMISNMVTTQLKKKFWGQLPFVDFLYDNGWDDMACVAGREMQNWKGNVFPKKCMCMHIGLFTGDIWKASNSDFFKYYFWHVGTDGYMDNMSDIHKWIELPTGHDVKNKEASEEMLSCDAVVMHFRCGDYISTQHADMKFDFYRNCISELLKIDDYPNKKYYVFCDDLNYIKQHIKEVGLDLVPKDSIRYMGFNKRENSIYDLKLMSLGKIILVGNGMFGRKAVQLSTRKEIAMSVFPHINRMWERKGLKNKYSLGI